MTDMIDFEIAGGSVTGRDHIRTGKNCQDAYAFFNKDIAAAVVCDGCGSSDHSEVGAKIGAKIVLASLLMHFRAAPELFQLANTPKNPGLQLVQRSVLTKLQGLAEVMSGSFSENVSNYFLFTIMAALIDRKTGKAYVFGCGDGLFYVNGVPTHIPSPNNAPAYLSYNLVDTDRAAPDLGVLWMGDATSVKSILIGTDGVADLASGHDRAIPGKEEKIGPISQFWEKDGFFRNPFAIGHRLSLINRSLHKIDWEKKALNETNGPLRDDATFVVIRQKKERA